MDHIGLMGYANDMGKPLSFKQKFIIRIWIELLVFACFWNGSLISNQNYVSFLFFVWMSQM